MVELPGGVPMTEYSPRISELTLAIGLVCSLGLSACGGGGDVTGVDSGASTGQVTMVDPLAPQPSSPTPGDSRVIVRCADGEASLEKSC